MDIPIESLLQYFIAPGIVALIVIILQLFFGHIIASKELKSKEAWLEKKKVFSEALSILDRGLLSREIEELPDKKRRHVPIPSEEPSPQELNNTYRSLLLVAKNPDILRSFMKLTEQGGYLSERAQFINLLRDELFGSKFKIHEGEVGFFLNVEDLSK